MLSRINCSLFRQGPIEFHSGLNVVLGDDNAANSIGKSTMLMIVDFVLGGNSYIDHNKDVVAQLNHHVFYFVFLFEDQPHYFKRSTDEHEKVAICDMQFNVLSVFSLAQYCQWLKEKYQAANIQLSFRDIVSLYSRVWGKQNHQIKKPLQSFDKEPEKDSITKLIKLFNRYKEIEELSEKVKTQQDLKLTYNKAVKSNLVPKVTKEEYKKNLLVEEKINAELEDIKNNILKYTVNVTELVNRELLELKQQKDSLLRIQLNLDARKQRLEANLSQKVQIKSKHLQQLISYFPTTNIAKLESIETFHNRLSKILRAEFQSELKQADDKLNILRYEIQEIDRRIESLLGNIENPISIVNRIYQLTLQSKELGDKHRAFNTRSSIEANILTWSQELEETAMVITREIEIAINTELVQLNNEVHSGHRMPPTFQLSRDKYSFELAENTGTGKAFVNLLMFDLALFRLTLLPVLIHDSFLFKNIETSSIENLVSIYNTFDKQCFIALDELPKYKGETRAVLQHRQCIHLTDDNLLFNKDWRERLAV